MNKTASLELGLAPMEGVTTLATRLWFALTSQPDFAMTPFLRVTPGYPSKRIAPLFAPELAQLQNAVPYRLIPQLMSSQTEDMARIAEHLLQFTPFVDINCGCPSPTVVGHHAGSGLLETPEIFYRFTQKLKEHIGNAQMSIKMRSGFHHDTEFPALLEVVNMLNPAQLTLHARTRADGYKGRARWLLIQKAMQTCSFPIVGSGDVRNHSTFHELINVASGIQKIIIGRGALRNPWVFHEIRSAKAVTISAQTLIYALAVFALLHEMEMLCPEKIIALANTPFFSNGCFANEEKWKQQYCTLSLFRYEKYIDVMELEIERTSFAKLKMLWNYLRSSLPAQMMTPAILRTSSFAQFATTLSSLWQEEECRTFSLQYSSQHDWIYSGEKRERTMH